MIPSLVSIYFPSAPDCSSIGQRRGDVKDHQAVFLDSMIERMVAAKAPGGTGTVCEGENISTVCRSPWELVARTLYYAANVGKFLIRRRNVQPFASAATCLVVYFCWHASLFLRLAAIFGILGLRMVSDARYRDPVARMNARFASREAKVNAITEARLRREPWRRPRAPLSVPEDHVERYIGDRQKLADTLFVNYLRMDQGRAEK